MVEDSLLTTIGALFIGAMLVETTLYFAAPGLYARAALVPLGTSRRIAIDPARREALAAPAPPLAGYRQSAARSLDLTRLALPPSLSTSAFVIHFYPHRAFATGRLCYGMWSRVLGLVRVDMTEAGGAVELRARFVAFGWPAMLLVTPIATAIVLAHAAEAGPLLAGGASFVLLNTTVGWLLARRQLLAATAQIEAQLEQAIAQA